MQTRENLKNCSSEVSDINKIATIRRRKLLINKRSQQSDLINNIKHYPPSNKEWFNSVYAYNINTVKPYVSLDKTASKLISNYFNLYSNRLEGRVKKMSARWLRIKRAKLSINKIIVSKPELKHRNNKVIITLYVYNAQKKYYLNKIKRISTMYQLDRLKGWNFSDKYNFFIVKLNKYINKTLDVKDITNFTYKNTRSNLVKHIFSKRNLDQTYKTFSKIFHKGSYLLEFPKKLSIGSKKSKDTYKSVTNVKKILANRRLFLNNSKVKFYQKIINKINMKVLGLKSTLISKLKKQKCFYLNKKDLPLKQHNDGKQAEKYYLPVRSYIRDFSQKILRKEIIFSYFKQLIKFNSIKFEKNYIFILGEEIKKIYGKNVEFNFVNMKYPYLDNSIFSTILITKLKKRKSYYTNILNKFLHLSHVPSTSYGDKENTYEEMYGNRIVIQNLNLNYYVTKLALGNFFNITSWKKTNKLKAGVDVLDNILLNLGETGRYSLKNKPFENYWYKLTKVIKSVKYKSLNGIRVELAGRLSKRNIASRSIFKLKYKGNIRDVDSSFKNLSTVNLRSHNKPNLRYSKVGSKVRIGAFGLKGWMSSK